MTLRIISFFGIFVLLGIAWVFSSKKKHINLKTVFMGILLQIIFAVIVLKSPPGRAFFSFMNDIIVKLLTFADAGAEFLFGSLITNKQTFGYIFAFQVLPTIIFFSALMSVLYYLGIMQLIVVLFAKIMTRFMGTSGAESLAASANIFVGQTEAPLVVRPYVGEMTMSELLCVMTGGMATIAGGVMAAYVSMLKDYFPQIAGHLLTASIMSAPAALVMSKIILPETEESKTAGVVKIHYSKTDANIIDAAANGATLGCTLALNVGACLVAFMALLTLINAILGYFGSFVGLPDLSLQKLFGYVFSPLAWIMGVPWKDCFTIGDLMGQKTALNEFVAYFNLAKFLRDNPAVLDSRSIVIASYALCGFSNFLSIAIQIGGIGGIAPHRRGDLAKLGLRSVLAGTLACFMTATIAGMLI
ncbi:MAG: NupC/NupG family nucleoside CNT transporter [Elusimicrobiota bacterium]|nr:NupC/NupG family nucleoside CNT transporter [Elusimicrobiota bacterium]